MKDNTFLTSMVIDKDQNLNQTEQSKKESKMPYQPSTTIRKSSNYQNMTSGLDE